MIFLTRAKQNEAKKLLKTIWNAHYGYKDISLEVDGREALKQETAFAEAMATLAFLIGERDGKTPDKWEV